MTFSTDFSILPEDVLIHIFEQLHYDKQSNLINVTLVCKKWNRVISQTPCLMDKLQLNLNSRSFDSKALLEDFKLTRFYRHAVWDNQRERGKVPQKIFNEITTLDQLNTLEVSHWDSSNEELSEIFQQLSRCKFLRCLIFKGCYICYMSDQEIKKIQRIEFNNLKKL